MRQANVHNRFKTAATNQSKSFDPRRLDDTITIYTPGRTRHCSQFLFNFWRDRRRNGEDAPNMYALCLLNPFLTFTRGLMYTRPDRRPLAVKLKLLSQRMIPHHKNSSNFRTQRISALLLWKIRFALPKSLNSSVGKHSGKDAIRGDVVLTPHSLSSS